MPRPRIATGPSVRDEAMLSSITTSPSPIRKSPALVSMARRRSGSIVTSLAVVRVGGGLLQRVDAAVAVRDRQHQHAQAEAPGAAAVWIVLVEVAPGASGVTAVAVHGGVAADVAAIVLHLDMRASST